MRRLVKQGVIASSRVVSIVYDSDYQDYLDKAATESMLIPTLGERIAQNDFWLNFKTGLINGTNPYSKLDMARLFAHGVGCEELTTIDMIDPSMTLGSLVGSPTYTDLEGLEGDGTGSVYYDSNWNPSVSGSNYTLNDAAIGYYKRTTPTTSSVAALTAVGATYLARCNHLRTGLSRYYYGINRTVHLVGGVIADAANVLATSILSGGNQEFYEDNTALNSVAMAAEGIPNATLRAMQSTDEREGLIFAGAALTANELEDIKAAITQLYADYAAL